MTDTGIRATTLPSGLTVLTDPMTTVETVSLGVWVNAGTRHETEDEAGVSHLLEHMAFKGTERRTARGIAEEIEAVGGQLNAYTSREQTAYYAKVLKDDAGLAFDIIADILQHSTFAPEELKREQGVVVQEIHQAVDTPDDIIFDYFQETAFPGQPIGKPVLGTVDSVKGMTRDRLKGYMDRHYTAPRAILAAAGNIDHDTLCGMADDMLGGLPAGNAPEIASAAYGGGDFREARDLEQVHLMLGFDGFAYDDRHFFASSVLSTLLGGGMSSRLFQEIRENRGLVYTIFSFAASYHDTGLFGVYAGTGEDEVAELVPVLLDEMKKTAGPVGEDELARARAQLKASLLMALESTSARCEQLARQWMAFGRTMPTDEVVAKIEAVTAADLRDVAERLLASEPTVTVLGNLSKVPDFDAFKAGLRG